MLKRPSLTEDMLMEEEGDATLCRSSLVSRMGVYLAKNVHYLDMVSFVRMMMYLFTGRACVLCCGGRKQAPYAGREVPRRRTCHMPCPGGEATQLSQALQGRIRHEADESAAVGMHVALPERASLIASVAEEK